MFVHLINITEAIGRFHPLLVHLPIGILVMAVLLHWLAAYPKFAVSKQVLQVVYLLGIGGALLSLITGFLLSNSGDYEGDTITAHMWAAIGTTALSLLSFARLMQGAKDAKWLSLLLLVGVSVTGHYGGSLTHGSDYLTSAWSSESKESTEIKPIADVQQAQVYADVVQPLLQSRCASCHGPQKQKGGLRMDSPEKLLKGGKNGAVMEPGKPDESELIKRLLLPREDEDHMPPKEKPQLTEAQVALLHWWIAQGAPFNKKVADLQQPEKLKPVLASLQSAGDKQRSSLIPKEAAPPADAKAAAALRSRGVVLLQVNKESGWLAANFVTASFTDKDTALLLPLRQQLLFVRLNDAAIGDATLSALSQCTSIAVLQLNNTKITDAGLAKLATLQRLHSLSLVGTAITAKGLLALRRLPRLEQLFLYGTPAAAGDITSLKTAFPKTKWDTGGYRLPLLAGDTSEVAPPKR